MAYDPRLYTHRLDKTAKDALDAFPHMKKLCNFYMTEVNERSARIKLLSSAIRLGKPQMPEIYNLLPPICQKLGIAVPDLYYVNSDQINAMTGGNQNPYIILTSKLVKKLPPEMISSVLAHCCGYSDIVGALNS